MRYNLEEAWDDERTNGIHESWPFLAQLASPGNIWRRLWNLYYWLSTLSISTIASDLTSVRTDISTNLGASIFWLPPAKYLA
jgi:hypothetical protein